MRRRLSSNGVRRSVDPLVSSSHDPCMMRPLFRSNQLPERSHNQLPDRHIARDPRLRSFCVESVPSLIDT